MNSLMFIITYKRGQRPVRKRTSLIERESTLRNFYLQRGIEFKF
jgi:hypothetical protein